MRSQAFASVFFHQRFNAFFLSDIRWSILAAGMLVAVAPVQANTTRNTARAIPPIAPTNTVTWVGANDGHWSHATNWRPSIVPGQGSEATETIDLGAFDTQISEDLFNVKSLNGSGQLTMRGGVLNLSSASAVGALRQHGGLVMGNGDLTIAGPAYFFKAGYFGNGKTVLQGDSVIEGTGQIGPIIFQGGFLLDAGRLLRNEGNLAWNGGLIDLNHLWSVNLLNLASGSIENADGASWVASGDSARLITATNFRSGGVFAGAGNGNDAVFRNAGAFRKTASSTDHVTTVNVAFDSSGTVQVDSGVLDFTRSGRFGGHLQIAEGAVLSFSDGHYTLDGGGATGTGTVRISGDSDDDLSLGLGLAVGFVSPNPPTILGIHTDYRIAGALELQNGRVDLVGGSLSVGDLNQNGLTVVSGNHDLIVTGQVKLLNGGAHLGNGRTVLQGDSTISGDGIRLDGGRELVNEGVLTWNGGRIILNHHNFSDIGALVPGGASIRNAAGGTFIIAGNHTGRIVPNLFRDDPDNLQTAFINDGTLRKTDSGADNITLIGAAASVNNGSIEVETGHLRIVPFAAPIINNGIAAVSAHATLRVEINDLINRAGGRLVGEGVFEAARGAKIVNEGTLSPGFDGVGHLTLSGDYRQTDSGLFDVELAANGFDSVSVLGSVQLAGTLRVSRFLSVNPSDFMPQIGDSFALMTFSGALSGAFDHILWSGFDPKLAFTVSYLDNRLLLTAVPIPGAFWLFASACACFGCWRLNSRQRGGLRFAKRSLA